MNIEQKILAGLAIIVMFAIGLKVGLLYQEREDRAKLGQQSVQLTACQKNAQAVHDQAIYNAGALSLSKSQLVSIDSIHKLQVKRYEDTLSIVRQYTPADAERAIARHYRNLNR